jgi:hypothetical protein
MVPQYFGSQLLDQWSLNRTLLRRWSQRWRDTTAWLSMTPSSLTVILGYIYLWQKSREARRRAAVALAQAKRGAMGLGGGVEWAAWEGRKVGASQRITVRPEARIC